MTMKNKKAELAFSLGCGTGLCAMTPDVTGQMENKFADGAIICRIFQK